MRTESATASDLQPGGPLLLMRLLGAGIWLVFLANPLGTVLDASGWQRDLGVVCLVAFVLVYLPALIRVPWVHMGRHYGFAWSVVAVLLVITAGVLPGAGDQALTCLVFVAAAAVALLPSYYSLAVALALFIGTVVSTRVVDGWSAHGNDFAIVLATAAVWAFRIASTRQGRLMMAERELSELAVEEERSRIARDLHDILGHSLTVISVKAELAGRLMDVDLDRARAEVDDLQRLSRDALADVRATAQGIRGISLPGEIASARSALESAGIEPRLPTVADEVPSRWRELFAWAVREGVTNVVRHSGARHCDIEVSAERLVVRDDGRGRVDGGGDGSGLNGLRQRARLAGATVTSGTTRSGTGFELTVSVPT